MAEEHRCEAPEGHRLCANNCGFFGSSATMNLCSKCYGDLRLQQQQQASIKSTVESSLSAVSSSSSSPPIELPSSPAVSITVEVRSPVSAVAEEEKPVVTTAKPQQNRCFSCRKRVGLTGFKCRCGTTFCGIHRYPEKHACSYDFKSVGREEIARANPLVKGEKLNKI